jgi:hypothetical protein
MEWHLLDIGCSQTKNIIDMSSISKRRMIVGADTKDNVTDKT